MPNVSLHRTFTDSFTLLPQKIQKSTWDLVFKLKENPEANGINFERLKRTTDSNVYSARVNHDYRAIIFKPKTEDIYMLAYVDKHDDAYRWAERRRFEVNQYTGTFQMYIDNAEHEFEEQMEGLFSNYTTEQLLALGIPSDVVSQVKSLITEEELLSLKDYLPEDAMSALQFLSQGDPYEDVLETIMDCRKPGSSYMESFLNTPEQVAVITSDHHLQEVLSSTFEKWRFFLHPSQIDIVKKDYSGSVRVLGGAGTGKTVVALHRGCHLAKNYMDEDETILVTTYTANLANILAEQMNYLVDGQVRKRIVIKNIDLLAREICEQKMGLQIKKLVTDDQDHHVWEQVKSAYHLDKELVALAKKEYKYVIDAEGMQERDQYYQIVRTGMKQRLSRGMRTKIWSVIEKYQSWMEERGWFRYPDLIRHARIWMEQNPQAMRYRVAIVDEVQDFSQEALKLIRALVPVNRNDLFFVGDPQQGIYGHRVVMSRCGIDIRGARSKRLRINYRTTEQIRKQAVHVLKGIEFDDLDGEINPTDDISLLTGSKPLIKKLSSKEEEGEFLVYEIKKLLSQGYQPNEIAIFGRVLKTVTKFVAHLERAEIPVNSLTTRAHFHQSGVHYGTMHRSKGLEFRVVFLVGIAKGYMPLQFVIDKQESEEDRQIVIKQERSLFYVAATRARERLYISYYGNSSPFLFSEQ
jgi:superfamily I DNA/RNA helicase/mRNA-degrading endonuclease RelE of RelBE toxin-antitoxin system